MTLRVECDGGDCRASEATDTYGADWLVVESEGETIAHLCSYTCLANWSMRAAMEHESVPMPLADDGPGS